MGGFLPTGMSHDFRCRHGVSRYQRCSACDEEREAREREEEERVQGPAWTIRQAIKKRHRWFDGCAFCPPPADLVIENIHRHDCPFKVAIGEARIAYGLHLVAVSEGWDRSAKATEKA